MSEEIPAISPSSEGENEPKPEGQKRVRHRRRKRGFTDYRKYHWRKETSFSNDDGSEHSTSLTDASVTGGMSSAVDDAVELNFRCGRPLDDHHICSESDRFSDTASEFYSDASKSGFEAEEQDQDKNSPEKDVRLKNVRSLKILDNGDSDEDEDGVSSLPSDVSIPDDLSFSDIGGESDKEDGQESACAAGQVPDTQVERDEPVSVCEDADVFLSDLTNALKLVLPEDWCVDSVEGQILRIIHLNSVKKAAVDKSIFYDRNKNGLGIFVHGLPIPSDSSLFKCDTEPDCMNAGSLADYIVKLVANFGKHKICEGITSKENLWDLTSGYLDYSNSLNSPCFRHKSCSILTPVAKHKICYDCRVLATKLERQKKRIEQEKTGDPTSTSDKYLSKEGIILKKNKYKDMAKKEKQRADRLEKQLDDLKIQLDATLKDELSSILRENQHKMSDLQRVFWKSQLEALRLDDKRGMRWHPMMVRLALHFHSLSAGAYQFLNNIKVLCLPSDRRLYDYSHFIDAHEGCQKEITEIIKEKITKCGSDEHLKYVNVMLDEMHLRSGLLVKRSTGELVGYTKLDGIDEELRKIQSELDSKVYKPRLAKKVLVYMVRGITSHNVKDVVAVHTTDDLSVTQLYDRTWEVIYHLEDFGIKVLSVTCDGASVNRKFIQMHSSLDKKSNFTYSTKNLAAGDSRPLFFILDPPHLLKAIRNALANSFSHRKTRKLWKNNEYLSWKTLEELYYLTKKLKFPGHKLTQAHIKLSSFSCMTVLYATQALSRSVAESIEEHAADEEMSKHDTGELVKFILLMNRFFDCLNGMRDEDVENEETQNEQEIRNHDKDPYKDVNDPRFTFLQEEVLGYFMGWKEEVTNRPGILTQTERSQMIISHQALGALEITVNGIIGAISFMLTVAGAPAVCARVFNQDPLEQYFSKVRRAQGDNRNPGAEGVLNTRLNLFAQGHISLPSQKGNTEAQKRKEIEVDATPLPSRKKPKKDTDQE